MIKNILSFLIILFIFSFLYFVLNEYFSEKFIKKISTNRSNINLNLVDNSNLLVLENDTNNVIEFNNGFNSIENDREKRSFWKLIKRK